MTDQPSQPPAPSWRDWTREELRGTIRASLHRMVLWILASLSVILYNCTRPAGVQRRELPAPDLVWPNDVPPQQEKR